MKKKIALILAIVLLVAVAVAGTVAWLMDSTQTVTNTFTSSDVDIELAETTGTEYKMVPGATINKDPKVTVKAGSEACYVFVKIEESTNAEFSDYMEYTVAEGWSAVPNNAGVYYREVAASDEDQFFYVLKDNQVKVKATVTKTMMDALVADNLETADVNESTYPTLTFTAYAIQSANLVDAAGNALAAADIATIWTMASSNP